MGSTKGVFLGLPEPMSPPGLPRRERAPTITIDTSAVGSSSERSNNGHIIQGDQHSARSPIFRNIQSPEPQNFLAVPDIHSMETSLDIISPHSPSSYGGEALRPTPSASDHGGSRNGSHETVLFHGLGNNGDPLSPDPGEEDTFQVENNPFVFSPGQLAKMFNPKSLAAFHALGGLQGLLKGLQTDSHAGLRSDESTLYRTVGFGQVIIPMNSGLSREADSSPTDRGRPTSFSSIRHASSDLHADRKRVFSGNRLPEKKVKSILQLMWIAFNDKVLILLTIVATISLALGLYQTFGQPHKKDEPRVEWVEGVTIMAAVIIVVVVGALNDHQKELQFARLNKKKEDRVVKAIRSGRSLEISVYDILVGDVLHLEPGDLVPADGVFISGHNVRCDESSATGETHQIKKTPGDDVMAQIKAGASTDNLDPFLISGSKVLEGVGTYLVTGVGVHSSYGKLLMAVTEDTEATPLQLKLNFIADQIAMFGVAVAVLLFIVLFIRFLTQLRGSTDLPSEKGQRFLQIFIVAITVVVIAVPEGLPLAVTLALAFAVTRMLKDNNLVRVLRACETMGNATTVCCDKTGTLTLNKMTVVAGTLGMTCCFGGPKETACQDKSKGKLAVSNPGDVLIGELLSEEIRNILLHSIVINTTAFEGQEDGKQIFIGSKLESALLSFAKEKLGMGPVHEERANVEIVQRIPFDSSRKCMVSVTEISRGTYRMYVKGAPEILLRKCTQIIADATKPINGADMTRDSYGSLADTIDEYATHSLRTIGIAYRDFRVSSWPPPGVKVVEDDLKEAFFEDIFEDMTFLGVFGIQDPLRPGVKEAVAQCQNAGVVVRMVTGDNISTARAIAKECGIYSQDGVAMEGPEFRKLSTAQMDQVIPQLQVLARSSPNDKRILVRRLKELGETVAVTGDGTNDGPALRTADVGFSMGISGTEVAKEASSIILMDDNFSSIVKAIEWGRTVNDAVRKFLQFQLTVNITAVALTVVSAIASHKEAPILTPVQLLWVNLIMDTFAALALATDPPAPTVLDRKPDLKSTPLITLNMWKMIIGQSIYQLVVTLVLNFAGNSIFGNDTKLKKDQLETLVFNSYVWMQFFNQYNNRRLDNKLNIFEGIHRNWYFIGINLITIGGQVIIIFFGGSALSATRLSGAQWGISLILGAVSLPIGVVIRFIPDELMQKLIPSTHKQNILPRVNVSSDDRFECNNAFENIREELTFYRKVRGGRLNALWFKLQHPSELLPSSRGNSIPGTPDGQVYADAYPPRSPSAISSRRRSRSNSGLGPAAVMAGVVAGSIGGWSPIGRDTGDHGSVEFP